MKKDNIKKWMYWFSLALAVIVIYKLLDNMMQIGMFVSNITKVLMPFILGMLIAYILYIPCKSIEKCYRKSK